MAPLSVSGTAFANNPNRDDALIALVELDHEDLSSPIRLAANTEDVTTSGVVYTSANIKASLPSEPEDDDIPTNNVLVSDIPQTVTIAVRSLGHQNVDRATVTVRIVRGNQPDWIEQGPHEYDLINSEIRNNGDVLLTIGYQNIGRLSFPSGRVTPRGFQLF